LLDSFDDGMTYADIAKVLGVSAERVKQIEKQALQKIAKSKKAKLLFDTWTFLLQQKRG